MLLTINRRKEGLRKLLLKTILEKNGSRGLLRENGGKVTFGDIWSVPFFGRKGMVRRVCTIEKRDHPAELGHKKPTFEKKGRDDKFNCRIPAELFIGCDETNVRFFNHSTRSG